MRKIPKNKKEWVKFKVGGLNKRTNWVNPRCQSLTEVSHVSHITCALDIFVKGKIQSGLVFDESKLNRERILVVWLSPNDWQGAGGFRYGNVRFVFDWNKIVQDMKSYWIESIAYGIPACRILLTSNDYDAKFEKYDPTAADGPWWYDKKADTHYWNGDYCLEIMVEKDLKIADSIQIDFVKHHPKRCSIEPGTCPDHGLNGLRGGARLIAGMTGYRYNKKITKYFREDPNNIDKQDLVDCVSRIWKDVREQEIFAGRIKSKDDVAQSLARAILNAYANDDYKEQEFLSTLFYSQKSLINSCAKLLAKTLHFNSWKELIEDLPKRTIKR